MKTVQKLLAGFVRSRYFDPKYYQSVRSVKIGVYRPSILCWSCVRRQYNYYTLFQNKPPEEIPDDIVLLLGAGTVFHRLLQSLKIDNHSYWDAVEIECRQIVKFGNYKITIIGHADAEKDNVIYEFKHTRTMPNKIQFQHRIQLNFYLGALQKQKGILLYTGYNAEGGLSIKEFPVFFSDWHFEHLITRAQTLHTLLVNKQEPRCSCLDRRHENGQI